MLLKIMTKFAYDGNRQPQHNVLTVIHKTSVFCLCNSITKNYFGHKFCLVIIQEVE